MPRPYQPRSIRYDFVTSQPFYDGRVLGRLLDALCDQPLLVPDLMGTDERRLDAFDPARWPRTPGAPNQVTLYLARTKRIKYRPAVISTDRFPRLTIDFDKSTAEQDDPSIFDGADAVAEACLPDMAFVHFTAQVRLPAAQPSDRLQKVMDLAADGQRSDWRDFGPRGLAMRTYIGPLLLEQLGRERVMSLPIPTRALAWGGVRVDLADTPWQASQEQLQKGWLEAMEHLRPSGVFATYEIANDRAVRWTRGPNLQKTGGRT